MRATGVLLALAVLTVLPAWPAGPKKEAALESRELEVPASKGGPFKAFLPAGADAKHPCPLLLAFHGHGDTAANFFNGYKGLAAKEGFALICPEGVEKVGAGFGWNGSHDLDQILGEALKPFLQAHPEVDAKRILWFGHSAGCWVCCKVGPTLPDLCQGILLSAPPTADLAPGPEGSVPPRVCLFVGTADPNSAYFKEYTDKLKAAKCSFCANRVTGLPHALPDNAYLAAALQWLLSGSEEPETEENTLPQQPPSPAARSCRHLLIRHKGAKGAEPSTTRTVEAARKEAERLTDLLKKETHPEKRAALAAKSSQDAGTRAAGGLLTDKAAAEFGPLLLWTCWTAPAGEIRLVRTPSGFHCVWPEK